MYTIGNVLCLYSCVIKMNHDDLFQDIYDILFLANSLGVGLGLIFYIEVRKCLITNNISMEIGFCLHRKVKWILKKKKKKKRKKQDLTNETNEKQEPQSLSSSSYFSFSFLPTPIHHSIPFLQSHRFNSYKFQSIAIPPLSDLLEN